MSGLERAHLGESPAWLGRDYLREVAGRRCFVSPHERDLVVQIMESRFASAMADRVAEGTGVVAGLRPAPRQGGRIPARGRRPTGRELLALGEAFWYTEDPVFVRIFCDLLAAWSGQSSTEAAHRVSPWERTSAVIGWSMAAQCMLSSDFLLERDATRLIHGLEREGRILSGWLHHHARPLRDRAAALAGMAVLGMLYPEAFAQHDWFDEGLGELALSADDLLEPGPGALAPADALQVYLPLVALSMRNALDVPGSVVAGIEAATRELGRTHRREDTAGPSLIPMIPDGERRVEALRAAANMLLGRTEREPDLDDIGSGLLLLVGVDAFLREEDYVEPALPAAFRVSPGDAARRPFLDTPSTAA